MAKLFPEAKVTVTIDDGNNTAHYTGGTASISGDGYGVRHIGVNNVRFERLVPNSTAKLTEDCRALCDPPVDPLEALLESVVDKAKAVEVAAFENARAVEKALNVERADNMRVAHDMNMAVLAYLHAGGTEDSVAGELDRLYLANSDMAQHVANLDVDKLYETHKVL